MARAGHPLLFLWFEYFISSYKSYNIYKIYYSFRTIFAKFVAL